MTRAEGLVRNALGIRNRSSTSLVEACKNLLTSGPTSDRLRTQVGWTSHRPWVGKGDEVDGVRVVGALIGRLACFSLLLGVLTFPGQALAAYGIPTTTTLPFHGFSGIAVDEVFFFQAEDGIRDYKVTG